MYKFSIVILLLILSWVAELPGQDFSSLSNGSITQLDLKIPTFLGNWQRNYHGNLAPSSLNLIWKLDLGKGKTIISTKIGEKEWEGSGWTGQPLLVEENQQYYLIQGALDHHLKKINAQTGTVVWQYKFDDVIKGTGTIWINKKADTLEDAVVIMQGSRRGFDKNLYSRFVPSFRAISYFSGNEIWRLNSKKTHSYSRDVDGSALIYQDTAYIGLENALFTIFDPQLKKAVLKDNMLQPHIIREIKLYEMSDVQLHGGNLVVESSPALLNDHIFITAGSGHVYGYNLQSNQIDWDFYIGSDMDGTAVITADSCLLVTVEKQYIEGQGGVFKLDPSKPPAESVCWYFPTEDDSVETWAGGIIGSVSVNDRTRKPEHPPLAAFIGIDGYLYILSHSKIDTASGTVVGPRQKYLYPTPHILFKQQIGPSISTPIIVGDKVIAAGYKGLYLFEIDANMNVNLLAERLGPSFESTPIVYDGRLYIGSRDGFLYCFGDN